MIRLPRFEIEVSLIWKPILFYISKGKYNTNNNLQSEERSTAGQNTARLSFPNRPFIVLTVAESTRSVLLANYWMGAINWPHGGFVLVDQTSRARFEIIPSDYKVIACPSVSSSSNGGCDDLLSSNHKSTKHFRSPYRTGCGFPWQGDECMIGLRSSWSSVTWKGLDVEFKDYYENNKLLFHRRKHQISKFFIQSQYV